MSAYGLNRGELGMVHGQKADNPVGGEGDIAKPVPSVSRCL